MKKDEKCGKVRYTTRKKAWEACLRFFEQLDTFAGAYRCNKCNGFHLTRRIKSPPRWLIQKAAHKGLIIPPSKGMEIPQLFTFTEDMLESM